MKEVEALNPKDSQQYWRTINKLTGQTKADKKPIKLINLSTRTTTNSEKETADTFARQLAKVHRTHTDIYFNHEHKLEVDRWAESMKEHLTPRSAPEAPSDEYTKNVTTEDTTKALKSQSHRNIGTNQGLRHLAETRILPQEVETRHRSHRSHKRIPKLTKPKDNPAATDPSAC